MSNMSNTNNSTPIDLANIPRPTRSVQPNCMVYRDDKDVEHRIYMPQGAAERAWKLLEEKNWDELAKFEPYSKSALRQCFNTTPCTANTPQQTRATRNPTTRPLTLRRPSNAMKKVRR